MTDHRLLLPTLTASTMASTWPWALTSRKNAVACGHWPLYRYNPDLEEQGKNPLHIDSKAPTMPFAEYALNENRYRMLKMMNPTHADELMAMSQNDVDKAWKFLNGRAKALEPEK